jgi:hypothetical protein
MATHAADLGDRDFRAAIARARRVATAAGEIGPRSGPTSLPLETTELQALAAFRRTDYRQAAEDVAASDPEFANC